MEKSATSLTVGSESGVASGYHVLASRGDPVVAVVGVVAVAAAAAVEAAVVVAVASAAAVDVGGSVVPPPDVVGVDLVVRPP